MRRSDLLQTLSLVSVVLLALHISQDIAFNLDPAGINHVVGVLILVVITTGAVLLRDSRAGTVIMLLGGLMSAGMLPLHMRNGFKPEFLEKSGVLLFTFTMYLLGVIGFFTIVLAVRELIRSNASKDAKRSTE